MDRPSPGDPTGASEPTGPDGGWTPTRWAGLLDRIEHRQHGVGLRFSVPPLWLEVTMSGPDSDLWPSVTDTSAPWNWQSNAPCTAATTLAAAGAGDGEVLDVAARYTIENLVLNAVHEIGEWLRLDGRRVFPAHTKVDRAAAGDSQGNGAIVLRVEFGSEPSRSASPPAGGDHGVARREDAARRLVEAVAPSRFTYLPGTTFAFDAEGPSVRAWPAGDPSMRRPRWSEATLDAACRAGDDVVALVCRDVHRSLVLHEADRICRAFHVDGEQRWSLVVEDGEQPLGADPVGTSGPGAEPLRIAVDHGPPGPAGGAGVPGQRDRSRHDGAPTISTWVT